jgi:hypothetical protein
MEDKDGGVIIDTPYFMCPHARFSALHHAALGGSLELIALLLEAQATVDIKDSNGETPVCPQHEEVGAQPRPCDQSLLLLGPSRPVDVACRWLSFLNLPSLLSSGWC